MCRHVAMLARGPVPLEPPLFGEGQSLERQTYAPADQAVGRVNADGWGVGWWDPDIRPEPARYRTTTPMWADLRFREVAPLVRTRAFLAAARNATVGSPVEETGNAPFRDGRWLFSFNGALDGFREGVGVALRRELPPARDAAILGASDAEVVFAMVLHRLDAGLPPLDAVAAVLDVLTTQTTGRFNLLLGDGEQVVASRVGNELATHVAASGTTWVASEPLDDDPGWRPVPEGSLVTATLTDLRIHAR